MIGSEQLPAARRRIVLGAVAVAIGALLHAGTAFASGGNYVFEGGTPYEQQQVRDALNASSFNWGLVTEQITIVIAPVAVDESIPGEIFLDPDLLDAGEFSWGVVQNEYANQVDFFLLPKEDDAMVNGALGGTAWCYGDEPGLKLEQYGCERFASTLAWSYWQSSQNCMQPSEVAGAVSAAMAPAAFRALIATLLGSAAQTTAAPIGTVRAPVHRTRTTAALRRR
ncbi:MAG TPA: hypothetical protein VGL76_09550 [Gaiellaceae bacterium]